MNLREVRAKARLNQELVDLHVTRPRCRPTLAQRAISWAVWALFVVSLCMALVISR